MLNFVKCLYLFLLTDETRSSSCVLQLFIAGFCDSIMLFESSISILISLSAI